MPGNLLGAEVRHCKLATVATDDTCSVWGTAREEVRSQAGVFLLTRVVPSNFHEKNLKINPLVYCATRQRLFNDLQKVLVIGRHDTRLLTHTFLMEVWCTVVRDPPRPLYKGHLFQPYAYYLTSEIGTTSLQELAP